MLHFEVSASQPYSIFWYHSGKAIDLQSAGLLKLRPLNNRHDLPAMNNKGPYLFKIVLNTQIPAGGCLLFIENEHLDTVALYQRVGGVLQLLARAGNNFPDGGNRLGNPQFRLQSDINEYYVLVTFKKDVSFVTSIDTFDDIDRLATSVFFQLGLYYGVSLMFLFFNLFLFFYLKDRIFLYYSLFLLFIISSIAYADGLFVFLTTARWILNNGDIPLHLGLMASGAAFALRFLNLTFQRRAIRITLIFITGAILAYLLSLVYQNYYWFLAGEAAAFLLLCFFWITAIWQFNTHNYSRFFVVGYGVFLLFALDYFLLRKFGIFLFDFYSGQLKTGSVIEMLVLTAAIMFRLSAIRKQNQHYRLEIEQYMRKVWDYEAQAARQTNDLFEQVQRKYDLSDREVEVLRGITDGQTNSQIAESIFLSVHTVKYHTRNIFDKLEISNRTQALARLHDKT